MLNTKNENTSRPVQSINEPSIVNTLHQKKMRLFTAYEPLKTHQLFNREYYDYSEIMDALELSKHPHHLSKRISKYPNEIITHHSKSYISVDFAIALQNHHIASLSLLILREGGI